MAITREDLIIKLRDELVFSGRWDIEDLPDNFEMDLYLEIALAMNGWKLKE